MRLASAVSCALIVAGLGACGGSIKTATPAVVSSTTTTATTVAAETGADTTVAGQAGANGGQGRAQQNLTPEQTAALQVYRDCLTANGLTLPQRGQRGQNGAAPAGAAAGASTTAAAAAGAAPAGTPGGVPVDPAGGVPADTNAGGARAAIDPAVLAKAQEACKDKMPTDGTGNIFGGFGGNGGNAGNGGNGAARATAMAPYYSCLKDNGVKVADVPTGPATTVAGQAPTTTVAGQAPGQPGARGGRLAGVDQNSPEFVAANEKCKVLIPANTGGNGAPAAGTPTTAAA